MRGLTGLTPRRLQQLKQEGNISDLGNGKYSMFQVCEYITYQSKLVEKRKIKPDPKDGDLDPEQMRARKDAAHAEKLEIEVAELKGELILEEDVRQEWGQIGTILKAGFQGYPDRLSDQLESIVVEAMEEGEKVDAREIRELARKLLSETLEEIKDDV